MAITRTQVLSLLGKLCFLVWGTVCAGALLNAAWEEDMTALPEKVRLAGLELSPAEPPLGLKTYLDLMLLVDETIVAADEEWMKADVSASPLRAGSRLSSEEAYGEKVYRLFDKNNFFKIIVSDQDRSLWCSYSKDSGATWSEPRFVLLLAGKKPERCLQNIEVRKLPGRALQISFGDSCGRRFAIRFKGNDLARLAVLSDIERAPAGRFLLYSGSGAWEDGLGISELLCIGTNILIETDTPPSGYTVDASLGLLIHKSMRGQIIHHARGDSLFETRTLRTPSGDYLVMIPDGKHASSPRPRVNSLLAYRSSDKGKTWIGPFRPFADDEKHHAVLPLRPSGEPGRLYLFETLYDSAGKLRLPGKRAFGYRYSDDDGVSWSAPCCVHLPGGKTWGGVGVIQMSETDSGTWMVGFHNAQILRGALGKDGRREWSLRAPMLTTAPKPAAYRMDELRIVNVGNAEVLAFARTREGRIWKMKSLDDGQTWSNPESTSLAHPDAPPMIFHLSDRKTLIALHHNRAVMRSVHEPRHSRKWVMPMPTAEAIVLGNKYRASYHDWVSRGEVWFSLSTDKGKSWSEPRFLFANALAEMPEGSNASYNCSYIDFFVDGGFINLFVPHRWRRVVHLRFPEKALKEFLTKSQLLDEKEKKTVEQEIAKNTEL